MLSPHKPSQNMRPANRANAVNPTDLADIAVTEVPGDPTMDEGGKATAAAGILSGRAAIINGIAP